MGQAICQPVHRMHVEEMIHQAVDPANLAKMIALEDTLHRLNAGDHLDAHLDRGCNCL